ncbi:efflux RND transporter periplasmic adaptor subunit [Prolixibacteraceae bacterium Z1-6]|uniref:Efflux RND transporter periplasmic adaptor subunit n=1 Tax=Draconibacterium aestuarii TaxID=2998507 RepID=A0A9X3FFX0_9BACT|nr:efflux RND transporter periplasmic adaptor subunit [Prolixibacteraceae bacterium Z1-6]
MSFIKNKYFWIPALVILLGSAMLVFGTIGIGKEKIHTVKSGPFELSLNTKGEINGKDAVVINLPDNIRDRSLRIYSLKIKDLVPEGTIVKKGDWVATLDAASINEQMQNNSQDLTRKRAELNDAKIDSTIQLTKLREELEEFKYDLAYKKLELEQAIYESPAYQRKKQVEYNKTIRQMDKKRRDYELKRLELKTKTYRVEEKYNYHNKLDQQYKQALMECRVKAPKDGMVMYAKFWGGRKLRIGDEVSIWNPAIATLPDMSVLISETYVQEIDITKIHIGDSVEINIDALPNKIYSGKISKITNIGQEIPGFDTKVFRVTIDLKENGKELKPSMTTDNRIIVERLDSVITIPRSSLFGNNGESYVYLKKDGKIWKKKVIPGHENEAEVIIQSGLNINDKIYTSIPNDAETIEFYEG